MALQITRDRGEIRPQPPRMITMMRLESLHFRHVRGAAVAIHDLPNAQAEGGCAGIGSTGTRLERIPMKLTHSLVMAGLVPAISLRAVRHCEPKRDHRDKPGDDNGRGVLPIPVHRNMH
jgi:hypothetical protein